jgi:hypothetical protein
VAQGKDPEFKPQHCKKNGSIQVHQSAIKTVLDSWTGLSLPWYPYPWVINSLPLFELQYNGKSGDDPDSLEEPSSSNFSPSYSSL